MNKEKVRFSGKIELYNKNATKDESKSNNGENLIWESICEDAKETFSHSNIGEYIVGEKIGRGSFGKVCKGLHAKTGKFVAIKEIPIENQSDSAKIEKEIELLQQLKHANIIELIEYYKFDTHFYLIFEYMENGSLKDTLNKFGKFPESLIRVYVKQILDSLNYLDDQNVIHRDVKCANILITKEGVCKLADFGFAVDISDENSPSPSPVGSPYWMAPELYETEVVKKTSDVWSLGCTVIEMITGNPPYFNLDPISAAFNIVENSVIIPPLISSDLKSFLGKCFERDPDLRISPSKLLYHPFISGFSPLPNKKKQPIRHPSLSKIIRHNKQTKKNLSLKKLKSFDAFNFHSNLISVHSKVFTTFPPPNSIADVTTLNSLYSKLISQNSELIALSTRINRDLISTVDESKENFSNWKNTQMSLEKCTKNLKDLSEKLVRFEQYFSQFDDKVFAKVIFGGDLTFDSFGDSKKGVLKIRKTNNEWKKRCVALRDNFLFFYQLENQNEPMEVVWLDTPENVDIVYQRDFPQFSFKIETKKKKIFLCGATEIIMNNWIKAIRSARFWYDTEEDEFYDEEVKSPREDNNKEIHETSDSSITIGNSSARRKNSNAATSLRSV